MSRNPPPTDPFRLAKVRSILYPKTYMKDRKAFYEERSHKLPREGVRHYHRLLRNYFRFFIPPGHKVLELGCGLGDLLSAVEPSHGVGVDWTPATIEMARERHPGLTFHEADVNTWSSNEKFDYIILSDLVNDLPDVQALLERLHEVSHPRTRLVINHFSNLWRPILTTAASLDLKAPMPNPNWLANSDMKNLLELARWQTVKTDIRILWPLDTPLLAPLMNRWLAPLPGLRNLCLTCFEVARPEPQVSARKHYKCSVVVPARNEAGNIEAAVKRTPEMGKGTELIFIEGHSKDNTWEEIQRVQKAYPDREIKIMQQQGKGKGNAVREAFAAATGDLLFILDADLTMPPEELPKFYEAARSGKADFVNGVRLVYPMEDEAMRFLNMIANKLFGLTFSWLLGQSIKDTLCGTKVLFKQDYELIAQHRNYFGDFDPFGDFDLLFGAAKLNLRIVDLPIRYKARTYGDTNIDRWRHGALLFRMVEFAARRLKFFA